MNRSHSECSTGRRAARRLSRAGAAPRARGRNRTRQFVCTTRPPRPPLQLVGTGRQHVVWHRTAPVQALQLLANFVRQMAPPAWFYGATIDVVAASDARSLPFADMGARGIRNGAAVARPAVFSYVDVDSCGSAAAREEMVAAVSGSRSRSGLRGLPTGNATALRAVLTAAMNGAAMIASMSG